MGKWLKRNGLAAAAALLALAACEREPADGQVEVSDAWVRLPASPDKPGAAYFRLEAGSEGMRLVGVSSPLVRWVELHETRDEKGVARMRRKKEFDFPSRGELAFEPGGAHAMLFGMDETVKAGGSVPLTFSFNAAPPVTVEAEVKAFGDTDEVD